MKNCLCRLTLLMALFCSSAFISLPTVRADEQELEESVEQVIDGNNRFALALYGQLRTQDGNLFLSPYSISSALAMTYAGARGDTATQMADVLHFDAPAGALHPAFGHLVRELNAAGSRDVFQLSVANALWAQQGYRFEPNYLALLSGTYDAALEEVDFIRNTEAARREINAWVEQRTNDKIKDLLQPGILDEDTRLVLTNAIYFKSDWLSEFNSDNTKDAPFTLAGGRKVDVPLMTQTSEFDYVRLADMQALVIPYKNNELSMLILLPDKRGGLPKLEKRLNTRMLAQLRSKMTNRSVELYLPRFKMTSEFSLKDTLSAMGMRDAFNLSKADFTGMNGEGKLYLQAVIHKAFVEVNESGTEAAAATAVVGRFGGLAVAPEPPVEFRADRSFLYLIQHNATGAILFMGRMSDPSAQ